MNNKNFTPEQVGSLDANEGWLLPAKLCAAALIVVPILGITVAALCAAAN